ncbi:MAG: PQQ-dependent sugar dehydrogenase, partial [Actinomycetota bacterium]|nr:PQQ-dependent sugar dehydrogenase [Actinomycetota bacterium]
FELFQRQRFSGEAGEHSFSATPPSTAPPTTAPPTPPATTAPPRTTPPTTAPPAPTVASAATGFRPALVAPIAGATAMTMRPGDDDLWIAQRPGIVHRIPLEGGRFLPPVAVLDIRGLVSEGGERGLLGLAFSADGSRLWLSYTDTSGAAAIDEVPVAPGGQPNPSARGAVIRVPQPAANHNGGDLHLGPDGYLWWGLGDGGGANDQFGHGQNPNTLPGTIVRIDPLGGSPYAIPPDNPFVGGGGAPEVWAYGLRNSFDAANGHLWIGDVGQNAVEEIDLLRAPGRGRGANLGWSLMEGNRPFAGRAPAGHLGPFFTYGHDRGCSVTGGYVYRGTAVAAHIGRYVYADFCNGDIRSIGADGSDVSTGASVDQIVAFGEGPGRELYALSLSGGVFHLIPR